MKVLTIYCSRDLEDRVIAALDGAGMEGFVRIGGASGSKFRDPGDVPRTMDWEATVFHVPGGDDNQVREVVAELDRYANSCETHPCLRIVVAAAEEVH